MSRKSPHRRRFRPQLSESTASARGGGAIAEGGDLVQLYGYHAAAAALANPARRIRQVLVTEGGLARLTTVLAKRGLIPVTVEPRELDRTLGSDAVHQGMLVIAEPLPEPQLERLCEPRHDGRPILLVVLDQVTDPHNVGAILRSAAAFGAGGLIMTRQHSPPLAGALAKAATGALEHVPVVHVPNLARALEQLADLGVFLIGLDGAAQEPIERQSLTGPTALVLGAEGSGLRRLTRETCDVLCRISTSGALGSLNVSNAAAVALHALRTSAAPA